MIRDRVAMPIGAVTQLTGISSHTLRKWESRYGAIEPERSDSGRRLYTHTQVQRLILLRDLIRKGHQIGRLSGMSDGELDALVGETASVAAQGAADQAIVVGTVLSALMAGHLGARQITLVPAPGDTWLDSETFQAEGEIALVIELPTLAPDSVQRLIECRREFFARVIVVYGFATKATLGRLANAGILCLKGPITAAEVLANLQLPHERATVLKVLEDIAIPAPRFSRESIARLVAISPELQCECPNHIAQLVLDISAFEQYSLECEDTDPAERALHARLRLIAANARALFEEAVAVVAANESVVLEEL